MNKLLRTLSLLAIFLLLAGGADAQVTANFTATPLSGCAPLVVQFTSTSTGTITGYSWNFGNSGTSVLQNPSTSYTLPGTYTVTLTVTGPSGTDVETKVAYITVYDKPNVSFTFNNSAGCAPHTVNFTSSVTPNAPPGVTYLWDFGDGANASTANPAHTYTQGGTYPVSLEVTNSRGCKRSVLINNAITVYPKPTGNITAFPTTNCQIPATVSFSGTTAGNGPFTVTWSFGDGGTAPGTNPSHTYTTVGMFTVKMYITDARGCKDSVIQPSLISTHSSAATFTAPTYICQSDTFKPPPLSPLNDPWTPDSVHLHGGTNFATFVNTTPGATLSSTYWDFGDGHLDTGGTVYHPFYTVGTDTVRMITDVNGCLDTLYKPIIVRPSPRVGFSYSPRPGCPAPVTLQFNGTGASSYTWSWNTGGSSTSSSPTRTYTSDGIVEEVMIIGTDAYGCKDTLIATDSVYDMIVQYTGPVKGCFPLEMEVTPFLRSSLPGHGFYPGYTYPVAGQWIVSSFHWDFGDGASSSQQVPTHTYTKPGIYSRVLTMVTTNGCIIKDTVLIHVGQKVKPSFTINPDTVCVNVEVYFANTTPQQPSQWLTYDWQVGQAYSWIANRDAITKYFRPDTYDIILYADSNGCVDSTICVGCLTVRPSNANFTDSFFCAPWGNTVQFFDSSIGATSYLWKFGDGNTSTSQSPTHTYATSGIYNVTLITHNNIYGCSDTMVRPVFLIPVVMNFVASDTTLCLGDTMRLTPSYTGPPGLKTYQWFVDDGNIHHDSMLRPTIYRFSNPPMSNPEGFHSITYKVIRSNTRGGQCVDTIRKNNYVIVSRPKPAFGASPLIGCTPLVVTFRDSSLFTTGTAAGNREWTFGDGGTASNNNVNTSYTYTTAGIYNVKLKITDWNGCADSLTKMAYILAKHPTAVFDTRNTNGCVGLPINFGNQSIGLPLTYRWNFGDGDTSALAYPSHAYKAPGTYTVRLIVTDLTGCVDTMTKVGYINISRPVAAFTLSDTISVCPPLQVTFTSTSTNAVGFAWDFGNSASSVLPNPVSTYSTPGVYTIRLIVGDAAGCADTATAKVRVLGYSGALSYTPLSGCVPLEVFFTSTVTNVPSMVWDFSDGTTLPGTGTTATHIYRTPGSYVPKLIFSDGAGCSSSSTGLDTIRVDDVIAAFKVLPPCEKSNIQFFDTSRSFFSPIVNSRWDFGGSGIATGNPVQRTYPGPGTYLVTLISTNAAGCKDTISKNIIIHPLPKVVAMDDTALCVPDAITLSASGALTYLWSPATDLSCTTCQAPQASPSAAITYTVAGTDSNGCVAKDTVRVGMQTKSTFVVRSSGEICLGQQYQLLAAGATEYSWAPPTGLNNPNIGNPLASPTVNTTYIVTGREGSCLADTHSIRVVVRPLPKVDAGGDLKVVAGNAVLLQASGQGITRVAWTEDPSLSCFGCYAPEARPKVSTTYFITAYNEFNCTAVDSVRVQVLCDGSQLSIPNTFTPNGDGLNDYFFPHGQGIDHINSFRVYSRWGELLFERSNVAVNDQYAGWNGTFNGRKLNPDVYVYIMEATCDTGEPIKFKGDVTLLR